MATNFSFQLSLLFDETVADPYGNWQYAAASAVDTNLGVTAQLIATKRTNSFAGNQFPGSMLTATVIFAGEPGSVAPTMTLQGLHMFEGNSESGSVSAASPELADQIGGTFTFDGSTHILLIQAPVAAPLLEGRFGETRPQL